MVVHGVGHDHGVATRRLPRHVLCCVARGGVGAMARIVTHFLPCLCCCVGDFVGMPHGTIAWFTLL